MLRAWALISRLSAAIWVAVSSLVRAIAGSLGTRGCCGWVIAATSRSGREASHRSNNVPLTAAKAGIS